MISYTKSKNIFRMQNCEKIINLLFLFLFAYMLRHTAYAKEYEY